MGAGDIWQVILEASYLGQQMRNVFYYFQNTSNVDDMVTAPQLLLAFEENFFTSEPSTGLVGGLFTTGTGWRGVSAVNLFEDAPFAELIFDPQYSGTNSTNYAPSYQAVGFVSPRKRRDVRAGRKRFGGVGETLSDGNTLTSSALLSAETISRQLGENLVYSGNPEQTFTPVIVGRIKEVDPETGKVTYRLPKNLDEAKYYIADNWAAELVPTTQNSRKPGRGI